MPGTCGGRPKEFTSGNASGINVAYIDNRGNVHADTVWWHYTLGNVRLRPFSEIWSDPAEPLLKLLRPRPVKGRCASCTCLEICSGNTRIRARKHSGDLWAEDPGCYLTEDETGVWNGIPAHPDGR